MALVKVNHKPAVLVIGGGVAGMRAALDIADAGYPVYLVEQESGVGGRMAQLDKTFPTLDCASCIITPMLADVGRHKNIHLLTCSEVTALEGRPGAFKATVHHSPRYVDTSRCIGCALCAEVCPVSVPDTFNTNLNERHAIYRLFPQAVPNVFSITRTGVSPCRDTCPLGQRIPGYIALIRQRRYTEALQTIRYDNPFPGICGRICPHPCEEACNRALLDQPLNIRGLKRFVADHVQNQDQLPVEPVTPRFKEKVAIIGAGPAGLTAAQDLTLAGYRVTVFEALPVAGGMLRVGVPAFRLPDQIIEREVQDILDLGVELRLNTPVADLQELLEDGHSAVLVAVGAHKGLIPAMDGSELDGVFTGADFLRRVRLGQFDRQPIGRVIVIGGGDVASDCLRTALRLEATEAACFYRRTAAEMPGLAEIHELAAEEGASYHFLAQPIRMIAGPGGRVAAVEFLQCELGAPDESGRPRPLPIEGSNFTTPADTVIFAVGQEPLLDLCPSARQTSHHTLEICPETWMTSQEGVFAAGDVVTGTATAVEAIAAGHRAAYNIHQFLRRLPSGMGDSRNSTIAPWWGFREPRLPVIRMTPDELVSTERRPRLSSSRQKFMKLENLWDEIEPGLSEEEALNEANRCLQCGVCAECMQCLTVCEPGAIDHLQQPWEEIIDVGAVIVATGFDMYDPRHKPELGYGKYPDVMHILEAERLLSASGPTDGAVLLKNGRVPKDVVFIQCVGSRDRQNGNPYCSRVCCMVTAKQAHLLRERLPEANITIFYIDIRAFGKGYEQFYDRVRGERVRYRRGNVSEVVRGPDGRLVVKAEDTLLGKPVQVTADLVVLATALLPRDDTRRLAQVLDLDIGPDGFYQEANVKTDPFSSSRPAIFLAGACQGPKDIPDTIAHARAAAASALAVLAQTEQEYDDPDTTNG